MPRRSPEPSPELLLAAVPMSPSLRALAHRGTPLRMRKGVQFITEGEIGDTLYIVLSGRLRAFSVGLDGREITYGEYGAGEYVGEMGLDRGPRSAHVETLEPSLCIKVTRETLMQHFRDDPDFAFELLAKVIWRARTATHSLQTIALNNVYGRLKELLERISVAQPDGTRLVERAPTQLEMSQSIGCAKAMVGRLLRDLRQGGFVSIEGRRLQLCKPLPAKW